MGHSTGDDRIANEGIRLAEPLENAAGRRSDRGTEAERLREARGVIGLGCFHGIDCVAPLVDLLPSVTDIDELCLLARNIQDQRGPFPELRLGR